ncbi:MAG: hypothetical protein R2854_17735 [Caldilineaceae bacterium]
MVGRWPVCLCARPARCPRRWCLTRAAPCAPSHIRAVRMVTWCWPDILGTSVDIVAAT